MDFRRRETSTALANFFSLILDLKLIFDCIKNYTNSHNFLSSINIEVHSETLIIFYLHLKKSENDTRDALHQQKNAYQPKSILYNVIFGYYYNSERKRDQHKTFASPK